MKSEEEEGPGENPPIFFQFCQLSGFSDPLAAFPPKKRQTLASLCDRCTSATARDQRAHTSFSASALFSERLRGEARSVKTDIMLLL